MHYRGPGLGGVLTPGVKGLMIANGGVFLIQQFTHPNLVYLLGLTPAAFWGQGALWQVGTYMFLHGGFTHLLFNMLALWIFGGALESLWGTKKFLRYYFLTGIGAGLSNCILTPGLGSIIIGASGSVYGLLAAYGILFPESVIYIWMLFPIRAKYLVIIFGVLEFLASIRPGTSPIAHVVHLGGMIIGIVYLKWDFILRWIVLVLKGKHPMKPTVTYTIQDQPKRPPRSETDEERLRREVDDLLDKISEVGLENLTSWEKRRLRDASERLRQMEGKDE